MLIGHGSSGTTMVARLCRAYLGISFGTESQFIVRYYQQLERYGDLSQDRNLCRLVDDLLKERWFARGKKNFGFETDRESILENVEQRTYRGVLDAVFNQLARHHGMERCGDKTPEYVYHLPVIGELYPDAKYVTLLRDGRDVACSMMNVYWGPKNIYMAASEWRDAVDRVDQFIDTLPPSQTIELTYEGMLTRPVESFQRLIEFLEIDDQDGQLIDSITEKVDIDMKRDNFNKWRKRWSESQRRLFERIAADALRRHGYETTLEQSDDTFNSAQRMYWRCENKLKKWTWARYWKDNFYRAKIRGTDLLRRVTPRSGG